MIIPSDSRDLPDAWYNIVPDLDFDMPPLMSTSGYPLGKHELEPLSPSPMIAQEFEKEKRDIAIPREVLQIYSNWRPTPLFRAEKLEKALKTPAQIFYKYEGGGSSVSHEANTAVAQAYYASSEETKRLITATGHGEWGASLAIACNHFDMQCRVYMVRSSYEREGYGRYLMEILGAAVSPSPSEKTRAGKKALSEDPKSPGNLSIALSEAFENAYSDYEARFCWGTVMNHVVQHQTIIGLEAGEQMRRAKASPDILIAAVGGGSAFGGLVFPFYRERREKTRMIAVETAASPSLSKGRYTYDYADSSGLSIMLKMYTLGHGFIQPAIRAGGMRYHGISPIISALHRKKEIEVKAYTEQQAFEAALVFTRAEGMIPSLESAYAVKAVLDEALACKERKERKNILFVLDANSYRDLDSFKDFLGGGIKDHPFREEDVQAALKQMPQIE
ncbi:MAG: TrpB-like pyridoxal phosphate-dependent enzyme [Dehalococcoidia bacterium]|nr:MAG: TrpB-like pyridoxal phosphate-dependent enzyme [Dehalococcoidia bacterium]